MKASALVKLVLICSVALAGLAARADDIDIYGAPPSGATPNVLIIVDNASVNQSAYPSTCPFSAVTQNSPTKLLDLVSCSLYGALDAIKNQPALLGKLNIGLMVEGSGSNSGGQMYFPSASPYNLPLMDDNGITKFKNIVAAGIPTSPGQASLDGTMQEAWAWLTGTTGPRSGTPYPTRQIGTVACQKTFIILIGAAAKNGQPDAGIGYTSATDLANAGATTAQQTQINTSSLGPNTGDDGAWIDEWTRFLNQTNFNPSNPSDPQNVVTYTIAAGGTAPPYNQILRSTALQGGGKPFIAADYNAIVQALLQIFNEVQAVNSVFASASLPVSANAQGTYLNQVFMGTFRPDGAGAPRWMGNLKQYQFGVDTTSPTNPTLFLGDASRGPYQPNTTATSALNGNTGFLAPTAISFWTSKDTSKSPDAAPPTGTNGFWVNRPQSAGGAFDWQDGEVVEKGGVGQQIRLANLTDNYSTNPTGPRNVYTCIGSGCTNSAALSTMPFSTTNTNLTATTLGINNPTYTVGVSSISRNSSTNVATVNLTTTPSPAIAMPTSVVISGSTSGQFDGSLTNATPAASGSTVTYTLPLETPPTTPIGSYTVTGSTAGSSGVSSLTRTTNAGLITVSATLSDPTFSGGALAAVGDTLNIAGSTGYNGAATLTAVSGSNVSFTMMDSPSVYDGGGQIYVGTSCKTNGNSPNCVVFGGPNANPPGTSPPSGLIRGTNASLSTTGQVLMVNFPSGTTIPLATGATAKIIGTNYGSTSGYPIKAIGAACSVTNTYSDGTVLTYTGAASSGSKTYSICLDLGASFAYMPSLGGNGATVGSTTATRQNPGATRSIASMSRGASNCPTSNFATVTAQTTLPNSYASGETVAIASSNPGPNEAAYNGKFIISVVDATHFTFNVPTSPACSDSKSGMSISYQSSLGGIDPNSLINWVRGSDNVGDEPSPGNGITIRPSVHGDVLHSRPAVINYGNQADATGKKYGVVVFYGANDGMFRAINGNQPPAGKPAPAPMGSCTISSDCAIGGTPPGGELWSFVPSEFYSKLQRLYNNSPSVQLPTTPAGIVPTPQPKDYFFDGTPSVYQNAATGKAYIFLAARRGGRLLYALDVSNPTAPKFMWKHTNADAGFAELGQTWSQPKVAFIKGNANPVLIFGAGYNPAEDDEPPTAYGTNGGRGIFIVDAVTGNMLWQAVSPSASCTAPCVQPAGMNYAIPADITLVDRNFDGYIDRLYASDVGGNIWRVDLEPKTGVTSLNSAQVTLLAALGGTGTTKRKMFFPPDVVVTNKFDAVVASTGDREHPLASEQASSVVNRFYMIKDTNVGMDGSSWTAVLDDSSSTTSGTPTSTPTLFDATSTLYDGSLPGFYITLRAGEKGVNAPTTVGGKVYFGTNQPTSSTNTCANLGIARSYAVNFITGASRQVVLVGGGLVPSPVFGIVTVDVNGHPQQLPFLIGGGDGSGPDATSGLGATSPVIPVNVKKKRTYWYRNIDR